MDAAKQRAANPCNIVMRLYAKIYNQNNFHIDLGLHIYHVVRSKQVLGTLWQIGLTCSYNNVRELMTALARKNVIKEKSVYIPHGIES